MPEREASLAGREWASLAPAARERDEVGRRGELDVHGKLVLDPDERAEQLVLQRGRYSANGLRLRAGLGAARTSEVPASGTPAARRSRDGGAAVRRSRRAATRATRSPARGRGARARRAPHPAVA